VNMDNKTRLRIQFLVRVVTKERDHLLVTDQRLFSQPFDIDRVKQMGVDVDLSERVEAFVGRFGRLQDTLGDKLLPMLLAVLGERTAAFIDNLDRAERLGFIDSADEWMSIRHLRNQMVHEYIEDPLILLFLLLTKTQGAKHVRKKSRKSKNAAEQQATSWQKIFITMNAVRSSASTVGLKMNLMREWCE